jgi:hypothetical protein
MINIKSIKKTNNLEDLENQDQEVIAQAFQKIKKNLQNKKKAQIIITLIKILSKLMQNKLRMKKT